MTTWTKKTFLIAAALVALLSLAACGGDDDDDATGSSSTATATSAATDSSDSESTGTPGATATQGGNNGGGDTPVDICGLLTLDEVETALGIPVEEGAPSNDGDFYACDWAASDETTFSSLTVEFFAGSDSENEYYFDLTGDAEEINGLGDRAQYTDLIGLEILTDHYEIAISLYAFDLEDAVVRTNTLALGQALIARLDD